MDKEKLTPQQLYASLEKEFHSSNKLWQEMSETYANASLKLFDDIIKFVYQALTAMGIIAGFGFAGIQGVSNILLFSIGEGLMFASMMFGLYRIKLIYTKNDEGVEEKSRQIKKVNQKKARALYEMMNEVREKGKVINKANIKNFEEANKELLEMFGGSLTDDTKEEENKKDESWFINVMIILFSLGFFVLLLSFFPQYTSSKYEPKQFQKDHQMKTKRIIAPLYTE